MDKLKKSALNNIVLSMKEVRRNLEMNASTEEIDANSNAMSKLAAAFCAIYGTTEPVSVIKGCNYD